MKKIFFFVIILSVFFSNKTLASNFSFFYDATSTATNGSATYINNTGNYIDSGKYYLICGDYIGASTIALTYGGTSSLLNLNTGYYSFTTTLNSLPATMAILPGTGTNDICGGTLTITTGNNDTIFWGYPTDKNNIYDFSAWSINFNFTTAQTGTTTISYGTSSSNLILEDVQVFNSIYESGIINITKTNPLYTAGQAYPVKWYAEAVLDTGTSYYYTPIISFNVYPQGTLLPGGVSTTPPVVLGTICNFTTADFLTDPVGNIAQGFCVFTTGIFFPNGEQQTEIGQNFSNIGKTFQKKPPFGYFSAISGALQGLGPGSSTLPLFTASTTLAISMITSPLLVGFNVIIWLLLAFWIFHRFQTIEL